MKKGVKIALWSAGVLAVGTAAATTWWNWGTNYERVFKIEFQQTMGNDYKIEVKEHQFAVYDDALLKLPFDYKEYEVSYKDMKGRDRSFTLENSDSFYYEGIVLDSEKHSGRLRFDDKEPKLLDFIKNRSTYAKYGIYMELGNQEEEIAEQDMLEDIILKHFDGTINENYPELKGDGYTIELLSTDWKYCQKMPDKETMDEYLDVNNLTDLTKYSLDDFADSKTSLMMIKVDIENKDCYERKDELIEKLYAVGEEYSALSDFGGNYSLSVSFHNRENYKESERILSKLFIDGNETKLDEGVITSKYILEHNGYEPIICFN